MLSSSLPTSHSEEKVEKGCSHIINGDAHENSSQFSGVGSAKNDSNNTSEIESKNKKIFIPPLNTGQAAPGFSISLPETNTSSNHQHSSSSSSNSSNHRRNNNNKTEQQQQQQHNHSYKSHHNQNSHNHHGQSHNHYHHGHRYHPQQSPRSRMSSHPHKSPRNKTSPRTFQLNNNNNNNNLYQQHNSSEMDLSDFAGNNALSIPVSPRLNYKEIKHQGYLFVLTNFEQQSQYSFLNTQKASTTKATLSSTTSTTTKSTSPSSPSTTTTTTTTTTNQTLSPSTENIKKSNNNNSNNERSTHRNRSMSAASGPWIHRWLVLTTDSILIFRNPKDKKCIQSIELKNISSIEKTQQYLYKKRPYCFYTRSFAKTFYFSAEQQSQMDIWIRSVQKSMIDTTQLRVRQTLTHLFNACGSDEIAFTKAILNAIQLQVPKWGNNIQTMNSDVKRILQYYSKEQQQIQSQMKKDVNSDTLSENMFIEEKVDPWEIDFNQLKLHKKIAEGYFGEVYKGDLWGKCVAIKRLKLNDSQNSAHIIQKLKEEAAVMSSLRHPNCLLFMHICSAWPNICLVTEFVENGCLYEVLTNNVINDIQFFKMLRDICCGMTYLHKRGILHLDLKPLNLLVDGDFNVKVADFGLSRILRGKFEKSQHNGDGTILYMASELCFGPTYGSPADVFSFGVTLFELLYLREHDDMNFSVDDTLGYELLREPLSKNQNPMIPPWWHEIFAELIRVCCEDNPDKRPTFERIIEIFDKAITASLPSDEDSTWFIHRHSANMIRKLAKNSENHNLLLKHNVWDIISLYLRNAVDLEVVFLILCAVIDLAPYTQENPAESLIEVVQCMEHYTEKRKLLEQFQSTVAKCGKFNYFTKLLRSKFLVLQAKERVFNVIICLAQSNQVAMRFVRQSCVKFLAEEICKPGTSFSESILLLSGYLLKQISSMDILNHHNVGNSEESKILLKKFIDDGGIDSLVFLATKPKSHDIQLCALQALVDISIKEPEVSLLMEKKGVTPIKLASRLLSPVSPAALPFMSLPFQNHKNIYPYMQRSFQHGMTVFSGRSNALSSNEQKINSPTSSSKSQLTPISSDDDDDDDDDDDECVKIETIVGNRKINLVRSRSSSSSRRSEPLKTLPLLDYSLSSVHTNKPLHKRAFSFGIAERSSKSVKEKKVSSPTSSTTVKSPTTATTIGNSIDSENVVSKFWEVIDQERDLCNINKETIRERLEQELSDHLEQRKKVISEQITRIIVQLDTPTQVLEHVYLGSEWNSANKNELQKLNIKHIINLSGESPNYYPHDFCYLNIRIFRSDMHIDIDQNFEEVFSFLDKVQQSGGKALVHSQLGSNRSPVFVIAYVMKKNMWSLQKAYKFVKDKRKIATPSKEYMYTLMAFECDLLGHSTLGLQKSVIAPSHLKTPSNLQGISIPSSFTTQDFAFPVSPSSLQSPQSKH